MNKSENIRLRSYHISKIIPLISISKSAEQIIKGSHKPPRDREVFTTSFADLRISG